MFAKQRVGYTPQYPVHHMCAQSGRIVLVLVNNTLLRIDTQLPDNINGKQNHLDGLLRYRTQFLVSFQSLISTNTSLRATKSRGCLLIQRVSTS